MRKTAGILFLSTCLTLFSMSSVMAAEAVDDLSLAALLNMDLESAGFFKIEAAKAPVYTTVIGEETIRNAPAIKLKDLYELYVPGMSVGSHSFNGTLLGSRGILTDNNAKSLIMFDGQAINLRTHAFSRGADLPFMGDLKAIEIINGPGSLQHGSGALNGFVYLVPKNGKDNPGLHIRTLYGFQDELYQLEYGYGLTYGNEGDLYVYAGVAQADGVNPEEFWDYDGLSGKPDSQNSEDMRAQGIPDMAFKFGTYWTNGDFKCNIFLQRENASDNNVGWANNKQWDPYCHNTLFLFGPKYTLNMRTDHSLEFKGSLELSDFGHSKNGADYGGSEYHADIKTTYRTTAFERHSFAAGFSSGLREFNNAKYYFSSDPQAGFGSVDSKWKEYSLFVEDICEISDRWTVSLGGRYDYVDYGEIEQAGVTPSGKGHFTPRAAVSCEISPELILKASYQQGFGYPQANDFAMWAVPHKNLSAIGYSLPEPEPEYMHSFEVSLSQKLENIGLDATLIFYYNIYKDVLQWVNYSEDMLGKDTFDAYEEAYNTRSIGAMGNGTEDISSVGGELALSWIPNRSTRLGLSYSYSRPVDISEEAYLSTMLTSEDRDEWQRYPMHMLKGNVTKYLFDDKLMLNLSCVYTSAFDALDSTDYTNKGVVFKKDYTKDNFRVNMKASCKIYSDLSLDLIARNLLEEDAIPGGYYPNDPWQGFLGSDERFVYLGLSWKM